METERNGRKELVEGNENYRGVVSIPYVQGLSEQFKRVTIGCVPEGRRPDGVRITF